MANSRFSRDPVANVGPHHWGYEGDIVWVKLRGLLTPAHAQQFIAFSDLQKVNPLWHFLVLDIRDCHVTPDPEARRMLMEWSKQHPPTGTATIGGSFLLRTFATLSSRALNFYSKKDNPMRFFATPEEGLRWFEKLREELGVPEARE